MVIVAKVKFWISSATGDSYHRAGTVRYCTVQQLEIGTNVEKQEKGSVEFLRIIHTYNDVFFASKIRVGTILGRYEICSSTMLLKI